MMATKTTTTHHELPIRCGRDQPQRYSGRCRRMCQPGLSWRLAGAVIHQAAPQTLTTLTQMMRVEEFMRQRARNLSWKGEPLTREQCQNWVKASVLNMDSLDKRTILLFLNAYWRARLKNEDAILHFNPGVLLYFKCLYLIQPQPTYLVLQWWLDVP